MSGHRPRILVVDDDDDTREAVCEVLVEEGYLVTQAPNGDVALKALHEATELPDVILLDLMMPVMDGALFRGQQTRDPALAHIPVAVFSAHARAEEAALALKADAYLEKPLSLDELLATVGRLVRRG